VQEQKASAEAFRPGVGVHEIGLGRMLRAVEASELAADRFSGRRELPAERFRGRGSYLESISEFHHRINVCVLSAQRTKVDCDFPRVETTVQQGKGAICSNRRLSGHCWTPINMSFYRT
jgi:hypothetical protein